MNTTPANSYTRALTSATKLAAPLVVATCLAFAAAPASGVGYYWDVTGANAGVGGTGEWNSKNAYFSLSSGGRQPTVTWPIDATSLVFRGTPGTVSVTDAFNVGQLTFEMGGYSLVGGGSVNTSLLLLDNEGGTTVSATLTGQVIEVRGFGAGVLAFGKHSVFQGLDSLVLNGAGLDMASYTQSVSGFTLAADGFVTDSSMAKTSWLSVNNQLTAESGTIDISVVGAGNLVKLTSGSVSLNGNNNYAGLTTINSGILAVNGTNSGTGNTIVEGGILALNGTTYSASVSVNSYGILSGTGTAHSDIAVNGGISPGSYLNNDVGTLTTNAQTWSSGGTYFWNITNAGGAAGTGWDLLYLSGKSLTIGDGFTVNILGLVSSGFESTKSYSWLIADNISDIPGVNKSVAIIGDGVLAASGVFSLKAGLGTSNLGLYLDYKAAVPESKDYAMILGAITLGLVGYRRWRRTAQFA